MEDLKYSEAIAATAAEEADHQRRRADERAPTDQDVTVILNPKLIFVGHGKFRVTLSFSSEEKTHALTGVKGSAPLKASPTYNNMKEVSQIYYWFLYKTKRVPACVLPDRVGDWVLNVDCTKDNYLDMICSRQNVLDFNSFLSKVASLCNGLCNKRVFYDNRREELKRILRDVATADVEYPASVANGEGGGGDDRTKGMADFLANQLKRKRQDDNYTPCECAGYNLFQCSMQPGAQGAVKQLESKRTSSVVKGDGDGGNDDDGDDKKNKNNRHAKKCATQVFVAPTPAHEGCEDDEFVRPLDRPKISKTIADHRKGHTSPFDKSPVKVVASTDDSPPASTSSTPRTGDDTTNSAPKKKTSGLKKFSQKKTTSATTTAATTTTTTTITTDPRPSTKTPPAKVPQSSSWRDDPSFMTDPQLHAPVTKKSKKRRQPTDDRDDNPPPKKKKTPPATTTTTPKSNAKPQTTPRAATPAPQQSIPTEEDTAVASIMNILSIPETQQYSERLGAFESIALDAASNIVAATTPTVKPTDHTSPRDKAGFVAPTKTKLKKARTYTPRRPSPQAQTVVASTPTVAAPAAAATNFRLPTTPPVSPVSPLPPTPHGQRQQNEEEDNQSDYELDYTSDEETFSDKEP